MKIDDHHRKHEMLLVDMCCVVVHI